MKNVALTWQRNGQEFDYKNFDRTHTIDYEGGIRVLACSTTKYFGDDRLLNPDQALVGALSSCFMLTLLALASLKGYVVDSYQDNASGVLEKNEKGHFWVSNITIRPEVVFAEKSGPDQKALVSLFEKAHQGCFIANSIKTELSIAPIII
ncbi:MAG: OsmC family protein [Pseudomonadales bacterium]|nr:OsmC family protein [Pseudomonadales bacterium]